MGHWLINGNDMEYLVYPAKAIYRPGSLICLFAAPFWWVYAAKILPNMWDLTSGNIQKAKTMNNWRLKLEERGCNRPWRSLPRTHLGSRRSRPKRWWFFCKLMGRSGANRKHCCGVWLSWKNMTMWAGQCRLCCHHKPTEHPLQSNLIWNMLTYFGSSSWKLRNIWWLTCTHDVEKLMF